MNPVVCLKRDGGTNHVIHARTLAGLAILSETWSKRVTSAREELGVSCSIFPVITLPTALGCDPELHGTRLRVIETG